MSINIDTSLVLLAKMVDALETLERYAHSFSPNGWKVEVYGVSMMLTSTYIGNPNLSPTRVVININIRTREASVIAQHPDAKQRFKVSMDVISIIEKCLKGEYTLPRKALDIQAVKHKPLPCHRPGASMRTNGYGAKIPSEYMMMVGKKWHRVLTAIYGNSGMFYIIKDGQMVVTGVEEAIQYAKDNNTMIPV